MVPQTKSQKLRAGVNCLWKGGVSACHYLRGEHFDKGLECSFLGSPPLGFFLGQPETLTRKWRKVNITLGFRTGEKWVEEEERS